MDSDIESPSEADPHVERHLVVGAEPETIWAAVTDVEQLSAWLGRVVELDLSPGGRLHFADVEGTERLGLVEAVEAPATSPSAGGPIPAPERRPASAVGWSSEWWRCRRGPAWRSARPASSVRYRPPWAGFRCAGDDPA